MTLEQLYDQHIKVLSKSEQLKLIALISQQLAKKRKSAKRKQRSLMELEGLGAEIWQGIDAQEYVNQMRDEWDNP